MPDKTLILNEIKSYLNISTNKEFAEFLGIKPTTLSMWYKRNTYDIELIFNKCEYLNSEWLLTGKGEMLKSNVPSCAPSEDIGVMIPLYNAEASAGVGQLLLDRENVIGKVKVPFAREGDKALTIVGDSMTPAIQSGDVAVVRELPHWYEYLEFGNIFVVVTIEDIFCKVVRRNLSNDSFTLHSYNESYDDFEVPKKFINGIFKVVGVISQRSY